MGINLCYESTSGDVQPVREAINEAVMLANESRSWKHMEGIWFDASCENMLVGASKINPDVIELPPLQVGEQSDYTFLLTVLREWSVRWDISWRLFVADAKPDEIGSISHGEADAVAVNLIAQLDSTIGLLSEDDDIM